MVGKKEDTKIFMVEKEKKKEERSRNESCQGHERKLAYLYAMQQIYEPQPQNSAKILE